MISFIPDDVSSLCLHSGNLLKHIDIISNAKLNNTEQLIQSLKRIIPCTKFTHSDVPGYVNVKHFPTVEQTEEEKRELQTSLKIFLNRENKHYIREGLEYTLKEHNFNRIATLILSYHHSKENFDEYMDDLLNLWRCMEECVKNGKVSFIGVSDLDVSMLKMLYEKSEVKPGIVHINMDSCCEVPEDLQDFCKGKKIPIFTHSDPEGDLLPPYKLEEIIDREKISLEKIEVAWVTRLLAHIRFRSILSNKGYIVCLKKKND